jgi:hypothetical protein
LKVRINATSAATLGYRCSASHYQAPTTATTQKMPQPIPHLKTPITIIKLKKDLKNEILLVYRSILGRKNHKKSKKPYKNKLKPLCQRKISC